MQQTLTVCQLIICLLPIAAYLKNFPFRRKVDGAEKFLSRLPDGAIVIFCFAFMIFASIFVLYEGSNWGGDFSLYIAQARAILNGDFDSWLTKQMFIIENSSPGFSPLMYPWVTSLCLVPIYALAGFNLYAFKLMSVFFMAAAWVVLYLFLRMRESVTTSAVLIGILMFNVSYVLSVDNVISEFPYQFFSTLAIFLLYKRQTSTKFKLYGVLVGVAIFFAVNTRTAGLALLIALILEDALVLSKNFSVKKFLPYAAPYLTYAVLSVIFALTLPQVAIQDNTGYMVTFSFKPSDIFNQAVYYTRALGSFFLPDLRSMYFIDSNNLLYLLTGILVGALAIFGALKNFSENRFLIFYVAITVALVCVFNAQSGLRYIFGIVPFVIFFAYRGLIELRLSKIKKPLAISLLTASLFFSACSIIFLKANDWNSNQAYTADAVNAYEFIKQNIPDDKVVFFFKPRVLYLNTNVYSYFRWEDSEDSLRSADYVLFTQENIYPALADIAKHSDRYIHVYGNETFDLYRIVK